MTRLPEHRPPIHPGEMLREEFRRPLEMTQTELARRIGVSLASTLAEWMREET